MGWRFGIILLSEPYKRELTDITLELGLGASKLTETLPLSDVLFVNSCAIGQSNDRTIITGSSILHSFLNEEISEVEKSLSYNLSDIEILVLGQVENAGISGFSQIKNGKRVRTRLEGEEEGVITDVGSELPLESKYNIYELPFILCQQVLGQRLDSDKVLNTKMSVLEIK